MKSRYSLSIVYKSNERPFSTIHEPAREIKDDDDARKWHRGMAEGMGGQYIVTLLCDGQPMESITDFSE